MAHATERMTEGSIGKTMIRFAVPLFLGNLFQQMYNTADALIVGNLLGDTALAAVSSTGSLIFLLIGLFQGIAIGAGVIISRYFGAEDGENLRKTIHTNLAFSLLVGVLLTVIGTAMTPYFLEWTQTPTAVMPQATTYLRIYFCGSIGLVLYNACTGTMQALGDSRHPLYYLIVSSLANVVLDIVFIAFFKMDVEGAALATVLSQCISAFLCGQRLLHTDEDYRVSLRDIRFDRDRLWEILRYGLPSGLQNSVIAIANVCVQSHINAFGAMAMSGCGAYSKIEGFVFLPITSFTAAVTTFVGQNLGGAEYERAKKGARFGVICSLLLAECIGVIFFLAAPLLIGTFTDTPEALQFGVDKARICTLFYCLLAVSHCLSGVLRGAGLSSVPMFVMLAFWCVVRVLFLTVTAQWIDSILPVNWVYPLTWALSTVALSWYYCKVDWLHYHEIQQKNVAAK